MLVRARILDVAPHAGATLNYGDSSMSPATHAECPDRAPASGDAVVQIDEA
jgi:hypothetical protein